MNSHSYHSHPSGSNSEAAVLDRDIEMTRQRIADRCDTLVDNFRTENLLNELYAWAKHRFLGMKVDDAKRYAETAKQTASDAIAHNRVPLAVVGLAAATTLLPRRYRSGEVFVGHGDDSLAHDDFDTPGATSSRLSNAADRVRGAGHSVAGQARAAGSSVRSAASTARHGVGRSTEKVRNASASAARQVRNASKQTTEFIQRQKEESPLAAGLVCLGAGLVAALVLPRTRREDEAVGAQSSQLKSDVREEIGRKVDEGREELRDRDLDAAGLQKRADRAIEEAKDKAVRAIQSEPDSSNEHDEASTSSPTVAPTPAPASQAGPSTPPGVGGGF